MIVKAQVSLTTNADQQLCLVYTRDRSILREFPVTDDVLAAMDGEYKRYFHAKLHPNGNLMLNGVAFDQDF